jgi:hypothetical protein
MPRRNNMKTIVADPAMVAHCGLYCGACKSYLNDKCPGCHKNAKATWCGVRTCCAENDLRSCAECKKFDDPNLCGNFNNVFSKVIGFILRSDRRACINQIKSIGIDGHARNMAENKRHTMKRT